MKFTKQLTQLTMFITMLSIISADRLLASTEHGSINVSTSALAFESPSLQADFLISEKLTAGPIVGVESYSNGLTSATGYKLGGNINYMLSAQAFTDGWSVSSTATYASAKNSTGSASGYSVDLLSRYNAYWENGFNMNSGIGVAHVNYDLSIIGISSFSGVLPKVDLNIGYLF